MTALKSMLLCVAVVAFMSACVRKHDGPPMASEQRPLDDFTTIELAGNTHLDIVVGQAPSLTIEAPEDEIGRIEVQVRDETLRIEHRPQRKFSNRHERAHLTVTVPTLAALRADGGHTVSIRGLAGGDTDVRIEGGVKIDAEGALDTLTLRMSGAGKGDFSRLTASNAHVTVDGVGKVVVHPTQSLDATVNGVGSIDYIGKPREVRSRLNGLGRISAREAAHESADAAHEHDTSDPLEEHEHAADLII